MNLFALSDSDARLSEEDRRSCEGDISKEECKHALATMARNKVAGVSGFSAEFFSFFWEEIGEIIVEYINEAKNDKLFVTHRRGVLTLIPKKGNQKLLINKRPICLLDVIYKLTRALMRSGELRVLMRGWPKGPPLRIFQSKSRSVKIQTALERSRRTLQDTIMLTLFFDL